MEIYIDDIRLGMVSFVDISEISKEKVYYGFGEIPVSTSEKYFLISIKRQYLEEVFPDSGDIHKGSKIIFDGYEYSCLSLKNKSISINDSLVKEEMTVISKKREALHGDI